MVLFKSKCFLCWWSTGTIGSTAPKEHHNERHVYKKQKKKKVNYDTFFHTFLILEV